MSLELRPRRDLTVRLAYAYKDVGLEEDDSDGAYAPGSETFLNVLYQPHDRWSVSLDASAKSSYTVSFPEAFGLRRQPGHTLVDLAVRRGFDVRGSRLTVGLLGQNLLDEDVAETLVGSTFDTRLRGRRYTAELRFSF